MSHRWRFTLIMLLALMLVGVSERLASRTIIPDQQTTQSSAAATSGKKAATKPRPARKSGARVVSLYPSGSLFVSRPKPAAKRKQKAKPAGKRAKLKNTSLPSPSMKGNRPVLEVAYEGIGFNRYLDIIERVGSFFVLLRSGAGPELGPELSLQKRTISAADGHDMGLLAANRPHLVSDPRIKGRLKMIKLPANAYQDRVVLMLNKPFDSLLWETIRKTVAGHGLALKDIARVSGDYVEGGKGGVFLRLDTAVTRIGGKRIRLGRRLRVTL